MMGLLEIIDELIYEGELNGVDERNRFLEETNVLRCLLHPQGSNITVAGLMRLAEEEIQVYVRGNTITFERG